MATSQSQDLCIFFFLLVCPSLIPFAFGTFYPWVFFWISSTWLVQTEEGERGYILPHCHLFPIVDVVFFESSVGDHMAFDTEFIRWSGDQIPERDTREVLLS